MEFVFPPGMPDEVRSFLEDQMSRREMAIEDYQHTLLRFIDSQDQEGLESLKSLVHIMLSSATGKSGVVPAYYEGVITGLLFAKFNICIGCGVDHEKVMEEQMNPPAESTEPDPMDGGDPFKPVEHGDAQIGTSVMLSERQIKLMQEYGLDDLRSENEGILLGFICMNCGLQYVSIEDRMLRPPDKSGCSGCVQKEQWG